METTIDSFSFVLVLWQFVSIAILITVIVFGIKLVLKLFKLMDSQTQLNREKLKKLQSE
ncbi:hypothetical protein [uncultured Kordia sp.]|uniref:hypothetical protein n=1 Tax=uncultured Kordia sp. TaxID=507699 RepID=UPI00261EF8CD|nr:hypothetical protein [uncultured Kordia sp.]